MLASLAACIRAPDNSADIVFVNARAYTLDDAMPWAEALAVRGNAIIYVGDNDGAEELVGDGTTRHDLSGRMLLPGFIDAHMHPVSGGGYAKALSLNTYGSVEEWVQAISDHADAHPEAPVIFGYGFLASTFGPEGPTRQLIDGVVPDRPVLIMDEGLHGAWLNSRALQELNITQDTADPVPGFSYYKRDADGNATGYLLEQKTFGPARTGLNVFNEDAVADGTAYTFEVMNAYGVTSAFDAGAIDFEHLIQPVLQTLESSGRMSVRVIGSYRPRGPEDIDDAMRLAEEYKATIRGRYYHYRVLKIMDDGTVEGRTAAMFEDYQGEPGNSGATIYTEKQMTGGRGGEGRLSAQHGALHALPHPGDQRPGPAAFRGTRRYRPEHATVGVV
jgi:predicted amidohydrolase YtcJ